MIARCPECPIAGRCVVEWTEHRPWCTWAMRGGTWLAKVRELSAAGPRIAKPLQPKVGDYPPLAEQAGNALSAAARFIASGMKLADKTEQERRLAICCECSEYDAAQQRCRKCGCVARWKARIEAERCPLDPPKW